MSASGPQAERLSAYTREADLGYPEGRDALRGPAVAGREHALHTQLARMKTTVEHLQQVVQRQEIVINDYQIKYPSLSPNTSSSSSPEEEEKAVAGLPPWVSDPLLMSPLLVAYDERLGELQAANGILSEQVSKQKLTHDEITKENAGLRADLKNYVERMLAYTEGGGGGGIGGGALGSLGSSEQMNELVEMNDVLNKTNSIMSEQITMLESHLNGSRTALTEAQEQLAGETKQSQEQATALTQLSVLNRSLEMERDETVRRLQTATGDLAAMQQARDELQQVVRKNSQGTRAKDVQVNELKAALGELSKAAGDDQDALEGRLAAISDHARELKAALVQREMELDATTIEMRDLQQEHRSTRTDAEGMLKVMAGMEKNLAEFKAREDQVRASAWRL
jgi:DNA repair exonuclease SbcCD ATPase subunit